MSYISVVDNDSIDTCFVCNDCGATFQRRWDKGDYRHWKETTRREISYGHEDVCPGDPDPWDDDPTNGEDPD